MSKIFTHAIYLTNLASNYQEILSKTIKSLEYDLNFDGLMQGDGVVVHLGSHQGRGFDVVREQVADCISMILANTDKKSKFLIENSAGQNGKLCSLLEEIKWLIDRVKMLSSKQDSDRLGWCYDTCHGHAAGYSLKKEAKPELLITTKNPIRAWVVDEINRLELWPRLGCLHVNDSRDFFGSGRDRHANLGEGELSNHDLEEFLMTKNLQSVALILEVPGIDGNGPDQINIDKLKKIVKSV